MLDNLTLGSSAVFSILSFVMLQFALCLSKWMLMTNQAYKISWSKGQISFHTKTAEHDTVWNDDQI